MAGYNDNTQKRTEEATNLAYTDFSTDKAKDNAYMADAQKAQKLDCFVL